MPRSSGQRSSSLRELRTTITVLPSWPSTPRGSGIHAPSGGEAEQDDDAEGDGEVLADHRAAAAAELEGGDDAVEAVAG